MHETKYKIELKNIKKSFGSKDVLKGIDLQIKPGESHVIIGGSGTGKSVMLKVILGLVVPDAGDVFIDDVCTTKWIGTSDYDPILEKFGMLFQGSALFDSLPVWRNIAFRLLQHGHVSDQEAKLLAIKKLQQVGMSAESAELMTAELSGGMQKRVALARAIACDPEIIFFDEPTTGLDPIMSDVINNLIVSSVKKLGATALSITHDMKSARKIADRISMLHNGRIIWTGTPAEMEVTDNPYVSQFIHGRSEGPMTENLMRA